MSMELMVKAMKRKIGNPGRKLVLIKLADNANDNGECWPSYQHIADHTEMGRSTVKAHIKKLVEDGFLKVSPRNDGKSSNMYLLTLDEGKDVERQISTRSNPDPVRKSDSTRSNPDPRTSHIEPVNKRSIVSETETEERPQVNPGVKLVIDAFNARTGSKLPSSGTKNCEYINARLGEGYTVDDLIRVIDLKISEWGKDSKMCQYIRPSTLFIPSKFPGYLLAAKQIDAGIAKPRGNNFTPDFNDTSWADGIWDDPLYNPGLIGDQT